MKSIKRRPDPIFVLIEANKRDERAFSKAIKKADRPDDWPGKKETDAAVDRTDRIASRSMRKLCSTKPTSLAGIRALMAHIMSQNEGDLGISYADGRTASLFKTIDAALSVMQRKQSGQFQRAA